MILLKEKKRHIRFPEYDYIIDKEVKLETTICNLTPKFKGRWVIILVGARLAFVKDLISTKTVPDWMEIHIYMDAKNLEKVLLDNPAMAPKKSTWKEDFDSVVATLHNLLSVDARKILFNVYRNNLPELEETLKKLDEECATGEITKQLVQSNVNYTKVVYASQVIDAFLLRQKNRWSLYEKVVHNIGMRITYYAMYKYVKTLLQEKNAYLNNKEIKHRCASKVDAPLICYAYTLFANSSDYRQLPVIMYSLENRNEDNFERITTIC